MPSPYIYVGAEADDYDPDEDEYVTIAADFEYHRNQYQGELAPDRIIGELKLDDLFEVADISVVDGDIRISSENQSEGVFMVFTEDAEVVSGSVRYLLRPKEPLPDSWEKAKFVFKADCWKGTERAVRSSAVFLTVSRPGAESGKRYALGDVNNDGTVDGTDATLVLREFGNIQGGKGSGFTEAEFAAGDVDKNGTIDGSDATLILKFFGQASNDEEISYGGMETWMEKNFRS